MDQDAVKWESLAWSQAELHLAEKTLHVPQLTLNHLDGQFILDKDRKTNVQAIFAVSETSAVTPATSISVSEPQEKQPWQFSIDRLAINNAAIGFFDESLKPSFSVIVQSFTGEITNISSEQETLAAISLVGNVDGYSPVSLKGKVNLFRQKPKLNALLSFQQLDMGALSPYSAEYAGWKINKGLLSADLNYRYEDGKILGKNHVVIDHLEFGEKVRGTRVLDIPLRLGLGLLTDQNGIAILDTELAGSPDDPQFEVRDVIYRALTNTLKKIVTAPFKFLSNLMNTKEDLGRITFIPGESQLTNIAKEKLHLLTEAMKKRPKMRLSVQGVYDAAQDLLALQEEQVKSAMQKQGLPIEAVKTHNAEWVQWVNTQYQAAGLVNVAVNAEQKYNELIAIEIVNPERLTRLAHERAQAVKQHFVLQLAVSPEFILLDSETRCEKAGNCVSSEAIFTLEI